MAADVEPGSGPTAGGQDVVLGDCGDALKWKAIEAGDGFALGLTRGGQLFSWGYGSKGQLGDGATLNRNVPQPVSLGLAAGETVISFSAGSAHGLAVTSRGRVLAWGRNNEGQLGNNATSTSPTPTPVPVQVDSALNTDERVEAVSAGTHHSLALTTEGRVLAWGRNNYGQLGDGTKTTRLVPAESTLAGAKATAISAGSFHSLALASGTVMAWGYNGNGELGTGGVGGQDPVPRTSQTPSGVTLKALSAGSNFSLAVDDGGGVWSWGANAHGQLGRDTGKSPDGTPRELSPFGSSTVGTTVAAGFQHVIAVRDQHAYAWGRADDGRLGDGTAIARATPGEVSTLTASIVSSSAENSSYAVGLNGSAWAWGPNTYGELGNGGPTGTTAFEPRPVPVVRPEVSVSVGQTVVPASWNAAGDLVVRPPAHVSGDVPVTASVPGLAPMECGTYRYGSAPVVTAAPAARVSAAPGGEVELRASGRGDEAPSVMWQVREPGGAWRDIGPGTVTSSGLVTSTVLRVSPVTASMAGWQYRAVFTNPLGEARSRAATLALPASPSPTLGPTPKVSVVPTVAAGAAAPDRNLPRTGADMRPIPIALGAAGLLALGAGLLLSATRPARSRGWR